MLNSEWRNLQRLAKNKDEYHKLKKAVSRYVKINGISVKYFISSYSFFAISDWYKRYYDMMILRK